MLGRILLITTLFMSMTFSIHAADLLGNQYMHLIRNITIMMRITQFLVLARDGPHIWIVAP